MVSKIKDFKVGKGIKPKLRVLGTLSIIILVTFSIISSALTQIPVSRIENPIKPIDVLVLIDQSGSMKFTDPKGERIQAVKFFIDYLKGDYSKSMNHRIGVVNFGDRTPENPEDEIIPLTYLEPQNVQQIFSRLKVMNLGDTNFINALKKAKKQFEEAKEKGQSRQPVVVIFTDGEPDDKRHLSKDEYFREIEQFVKNNLKDWLLYVIAIDISDQYWPKDKKYWDEIAQKTFKISKADEVNLSKPFAQITTDLLNSTKIVWNLIPPEGLSVEVEPYIENVFFSFYKENPNVSISITDPNGNKVDEKYRSHKGELTEVYSINEPAPGKYTIKIEKGRGKVEVGKSVIPVRVMLIRPKEEHPQGEPFYVRASFLKRDGTQIKENPNYPLYLGCTILTPDGKSNYVDFLETSERGIYEGKKVLPSDIAGKYTFQLIMKGGDIVVSENRFLITVKPMPYLQLISPKIDNNLPLRKDIIVSVQLLMNKIPLDPTQEFSNPPNSLVWATLKSEEDTFSISRRLELTNKTKGTFSVDMGRVKREGRYTLQFYLSGNRKAGTVYRYDSREILLTVKKTRIEILIFYAIIAIIIFITITVTQWIAFLIWRITRKQLRGQINIYREETNGRRSQINNILLSGKKYYVFKPDKSYSNLICIFGGNRGALLVEANSFIYYLFPIILMVGNKRLLTSGTEFKLRGNFYVKFI